MYVTLPCKLQVLNDQTFAIFVMMALFTTFITTPLVMAVYKPARKGAPYKVRSVFRKNPDTELRMLACFHTTRNIPTMINLIESSRGTRKRGRLTVYAMHLMELSERSSAISMVHKARNNGLPFWNKKSDDKDQMVIAFEAYEQLSSVKVRPATAISALNNMHEDICACAHQKTAAMILLPFHKHQKLDGTMESVGHSFQAVNERVLRHAPCSVGILVDRGLGGTTQVSASDLSYAAVVAFFGGRDDREALAYGMRLAEHPGIVVTVVRFVAPKGKTLRFGAQLVGITADNKKMLKEEDSSHEKEEDDKLLAEYMNVRSSGKEKEESMLYEEKVVESKGEIAVALKSMSKNNLFIVGRMPPTVPLVVTSDCAELGPVGSFLATSEFSSTASVVVLQQYNATASQPLVVEETDYETTESSMV